MFRIRAFASLLGMSSNFDLTGFFSHFFGLSATEFSIGDLMSLVTLSPNSTVVAAVEIHLETTSNNSMCDCLIILFSLFRIGYLDTYSLYQNNRLNTWILRG